MTLKQGEVHKTIYHVETATVTNPRNGRDRWADHSYWPVNTTIEARAEFAKAIAQHPKKKHRIVRVTYEVVEEY